MMTHNPCLLIPCYNHARPLQTTLRALAALQLHCLIVDDGSDAENASLLAQIAQKNNWVTLERLPCNAGKGAATEHGMRFAAQRGFTHALQIDADGQHDIALIPQLLALSAEQPDALISGWPQYGADAPKSRVYGRRITQFWVHIETLSFAIKDAMCGFRVYPLASCLALFERCRIGRRMDFDIEILVRLYWHGVPMRFVPTHVIYPSDGLSHFALWRDNVRISWLHTRLTFGMLLRSPLLILRKQNSDQHWSQMDESGAYWGMWICLQCYRWLGRSVLKAVLHLVISYFFLAKKSARTASQQFLARVEKNGGELPRRNDFILRYAHFYSFGLAQLDRIGSWAGDIRREQIAFADREILLQQAQSGRGAVILTSHLGNVEMCRAMVDQVPGVKMNVLVFTRHAAQINRLMREVNPRASMELLQIDNVGPDTALLLNDKLERGEFIVIAADRTPPTTQRRVTAATFLGEPALFPQGPFIIAALLHCPVYTLFCVQERNTHHIYFESFADEIKLPRKTREAELTQWVQQYADRLQRFALRAPLQWFNFFNFWQKPVELLSPRKPAPLSTAKPD